MRGLVEMPDWKTSASASAAPRLCAASGETMPSLPAAAFTRSASMPAPLSAMRISTLPLSCCEIATLIVPCGGFCFSLRSAGFSMP